jgi:hypothetical protein
MSELDQCLYDTAFRRFWELRRDFKSLHRLKYVQYIVRIEGGLKNDPQGFFKYEASRKLLSVVYIFGKRLCLRLTEHCKLIFWVFSKRVRAQ